MSEILVDNLTGKTAAGDVTITDGSVTFKLQDGVAKFAYGYNQQSGSRFGYSAGASSSYNLNVSSFTDSSTGRLFVTATNAFATTEYIPATDIMAGNNTNNIDSTSTASILKFTTKDADSNTDLDELSFAHVIGGLA